MARDYAHILTAIWHDEAFLDLSAGAQRVYFLALSQDTLNCCGVTTFTPKRWSKMAKNTTPTSITKDVEELKDASFVVTDDDYEELWVRSFLKYDGVLKAPNSIIKMSREFRKVRSVAIRQAIAEWITGAYPDGFVRSIVHTFPKTWPEGIPDGIDNGFLDAIGEGIPVPIVSPSPIVPSPNPLSISQSLVSTESNEGGVGVQAGTGATHRTQGRSLVSLHALTAAMATACSGSNRQAVQREAAEVVAWATAAVDPRLVEEAIGWAESLDGDERCVLPRAVAGTILRKARDARIPLQPFKPSRRSA